MRDIDAAKIRRLDGGLLLIFRELLRRKRASEVAEALGLSQSAVSHALTRLRDLFGDPLFVRRPHGLEPTRRAIALGPKIEALVELTDATLRADAKFDPKATERRFVVAAPDFFVALVGARLVNLMRAAAPNAAFVMLNMAHEAAFDALKRGDLDVAIGRFGAARPGFTVEPLYDDRYCVVARGGHPDLRGRISQSQYLSTGHVFSQSPGEGGEGEDVKGAGGIRHHAVVPRWLTVLTMVAACDAIGTVPRRLAERHAKVLGLQILEAPFVRMALSISAVRRAGVVDAGADWFLDQVRKAIK
jgi:DNA-binding transcriptional LysR family regulator